MKKEEKEPISQNSKIYSYSNGAYFLAPDKIAAAYNTTFQTILLPD
jgi:hypothetical protein